MSARAPLGIGLVGYGAIAEFHVQAIRRIGHDVRRVTGRDRAAASTFATAHDIPFVDDEMDGMLIDPNVDAIVIASPSAVHATQTRRALVAGKHVLCEIPLATSASEAQDLSDLAESNRLVLAVCHTLRYSPRLDSALGFLLGKNVKYVLARNLTFRHENVGWTGRERTWTDDVLWHDGGHVVDTSMRLLGTSVTEVAAVASPPASLAAAVMDYAVVLGTVDGRIGSISLSYNSRLSAGDYVVITDESTLVIDGDTVSSDGVVIWSAEGRRDELIAAVDAQDGDFLAAITEGTSPLASAKAVLPCMRVLQSVADLVSTGTRH